jgi:hypothetical protein
MNADPLRVRMGSARRSARARSGTGFGTDPLCPACARTPRGNGSAQDWSVPLLARGGRLRLAANTAPTAVSRSEREDRILSP